MEPSPEQQRALEALANIILDIYEELKAEGINLDTPGDIVDQVNRQ